MVALEKQTALIICATSLISIGISTSAGAVSFQLPSNFNHTLAEQYETSLYFYSEPGDYIGAGKEWFYAPNDGNFSISRNFDNGVNFSFNNFNLVDFQLSTWWGAEFAAPLAQTLIPGSYLGATRFPFQNTSNPGLNVSGDGRGCNQSGGRFDILEAQYGNNGGVTSFDAIFVQYCENESATGTPALYGQVRYKAGSTTPVPEPTTPVPEPSMIISLIGFGAWIMWQRQQRANTPLN
jgi:hypothetical protein